MKVLMVCLGNICRSPLAEGILRKKAHKKGLAVEIDSAGFVPFHAGENADERAIAIGKKYGIDLSTIFSRVFQYEDFQKFDKIYVMDSQNYHDVMNVARTDEDREKVDLILNTLHPGKNQIVPDPYYGGKDGFEKVFTLLDTACEKICENLTTSNK